MRVGKKILSLASDLRRIFQREGAKNAKKYGTYRGGAEAAEDGKKKIQI
jgi:hypothetical protein